ncbi:MAG: P27 family phage terminase small subunit [Actinobacteria bacterium]|nr:P27 family phage terminase small subunit [Actinomycetota bacterium]
MAKTTAPRRLSPESKKLWAKVIEDYGIEDAAFLRVLEVGLLALDRAESCRKRIETDGLMVADRFKQKKSHPLLPVERDSRAQWFQAVKTLGLDPEGLE